MTGDVLATGCLRQGLSQCWMSNVVPENSPVFVLGFHRGGTTLLQRLLNCFSDLVIWGEHSGFLRDFAKAYDAIRTAAVKKVDAADYATFNTYARRFIPWANGFDAHEFLAWQRSSVQRLFDIPNAVRWGFKEIRYNDLEMMRYLTALYPGCRILFLTRNPEDILVSRLLVRWETRFGEPAGIERCCREFETEWQTALAAAEHLQRTTQNLMFIRHETLLQQRRLPAGLCEFLDLDPRSLNQKLFEAALATRTGSSFGDVRNRRLPGHEVALRISCVREFTANSTVFRQYGQETHAAEATSSSARGATLVRPPDPPASSVSSFDTRVD